MPLNKETNQAIITIIMSVIIALHIGLIFIITVNIIFCSKHNSCKFFYGRSYLTRVIINTTVEWLGHFSEGIIVEKRRNPQWTKDIRDDASKRHIFEKSYWYLYHIIYIFTPIFYDNAIASSFKYFFRKPRYYVHFRTNTFRKSINPIIPLSY